MNSVSPPHQLWLSGAVGVASEQCDEEGNSCKAQEVKGGADVSQAALAPPGDPDPASLECVSWEEGLPGQPGPAPPVSFDLSEALKIETPLPAGYTPSRKHCQQRHFCFLITFLSDCWLNWQDRCSGTVHVTAAGSRPEPVSVATQLETFIDVRKHPAATKPAGSCEKVPVSLKHTC